MFGRLVAAIRSWVVARTWMEIASQVGIFVGALAVLFVGGGNRWGFVLGLSVQPFWFYTTIKHRQWGIVAASVIYTLGWALGVFNTFIKPLL